MKVLIVGAGIGGLAVAQALVRDGRDVTVFERASARREGGAAVTLWSNGTGVLEAMNVSLDGIGQRIDVLEQRDHQGTLLLSVDVAKAASRFGHPHICLPRRQLLGRLADGLPATLIRYGQACAHIARDGSGVRVELADGAVEYGDVLIGADGRSSVVRDVLWGRDPTEPSGWATWQGVTAISHEITSSHRGVLFSGPAGLCGLMPAGEGLL